MKILIVDDEVQIRELLRRAFEEKGYDVTTSPRVDQALAAVAAELFDLIILDIRMPGEPGTVLLEKIRKSQNKVPVVIYSGFITPENEIELRKAGANEVLKKDGDFLVFMGQVENVLKAKEKRSEPSQKPKEKTVLIVDDQISIRKVLIEFFQSKGVKTLEAESGERALEIAASEKPSIVLCDMQMPPGMNGIATLKKLLEIDPKMEVVMVTAEADDALVKEATRLGAFGYILKPFDFLYLELVVLSRLLAAAGK